MGRTGCDSEMHYDFRSVTSETHTGSVPEETEDDEIFYLKLN